MFLRRTKVGSRLRVESVHQRRNSKVHQLQRNRAKIALESKPTILKVERSKIARTKWKTFCFEFGVDVIVPEKQEFRAEKQLRAKLQGSLYQGCTHRYKITQCAWSRCRRYSSHFVAVATLNYVVSSLCQLIRTLCLSCWGRSPVASTVRNAKVFLHLDLIEQQTAIKGAMVASSSLEVLRSPFFPLAIVLSQVSDVLQHQECFLSYMDKSPSFEVEPRWIRMRSSFCAW